MAVQTLTLVSYPTDEGDVVLSMNYDDVQMVAKAIQCVNPTTDRSITFTVTRASDNRTVTHTFAPGTTTFSLPSGANAIGVTFNSRGNLDGYDFASSAPV